MVAILAVVHGCAKGAELQWDSNPEAGIRYRIYRMEGLFREFIAETTTTSLRFPMRAGEVYTVTAITDAGESALSAPVTVPEYFLSVSSEDASGDYDKANADDSDIFTFWHTRWATDPAQPPHWMEFSFPSMRRVSGIDYLPRQDSWTHGDLTDYRVETSLDGRTWTLAKDGSLSADKTLKTIALPSVLALAVRVVWSSQHAAAAEISLTLDKPKRITLQNTPDLKAWLDVEPIQAREFYRLKIEAPP